MESKRSVVFFDGECLLCSRTVQLCHRLDSRQRLWFAALESEFADEWRETLGLPESGEEAETFAFWRAHKNTITFKSEAVIQLLYELGSPWSGCGLLLNAIPVSILDSFYDFIARNRRFLLGGDKACKLPSHALGGKILK